MQTCIVKMALEKKQGFDYHAHLLTISKSHNSYNVACNMQFLHVSYVAWPAHALVLHMLCTHQWLPDIRHDVLHGVQYCFSVNQVSCACYFPQLVLECPNGKCHCQHRINTAQPLSKQNQITHALYHDMQAEVEKHKSSVQRLAADLAAAESRSQSRFDKHHSDLMQHMDQQVFQTHCWFRSPFRRCIYPSCHHDLLVSGGPVCGPCHCSRQ